MISAKVVSDSINEFGDRATSIIGTFPRYILAELNTHRVLSKNSASSRAVPFKIMVQRIKDKPFVPVAWQKDHPGMQGTEYFSQEDSEQLSFDWKEACKSAIEHANGFHSDLNNRGKVTKQIVNRLLEPYMWHQALITGTEWENFFKLRSSKYLWAKEMDKAVEYRTLREVLRAMRSQGVNTTNIEKAPLIEWLKMNKGQADIHLMLFTESIIDAMYDSKPKELQAGEWHIPFGDKIDDKRITETLYKMNGESFLIHDSDVLKGKIEIATARCARTSYINYEGKDDYESDFRLFNTLSKSGHWSPFEHCCQVMTKEQYEEYTHTIPKYDKKGNVIGCDVIPGWCRNFKGFIQLRAMIEK